MCVFRFVKPPACETVFNTIERQIIRGCICQAEQKHFWSRIKIFFPLCSVCYVRILVLFLTQKKIKNTCCHMKTLSATLLSFRSLKYLLNPNTLVLYYCIFLVSDCFEIWGQKNPFLVMHMCLYMLGIGPLC